MKKLLGILGVGFLAVAVLSLPACKGKSASERMAEKAIEQATGGKAEVDVKGGTVSIKTKDGEMQVGGVNGWPADMPADVPQPAGFKIKGAAKTTQGSATGWIVNFKEIEKDAVLKYIEVLKAAGFSSNVSMEVEGSVVFEGKKGTVSIWGGYTESDQGLSINVTQ